MINYTPKFVKIRHILLLFMLFVYAWFPWLQKIQQHVRMYNVKVYVVASDPRKENG